ncbi:MULTISPECIES: hypothetical protein [unclassified Streptomyces]|uniref:hypothetical protein n=1 Tax=unclassified Streptomyces TaxID=2593676 RepID=UPI00364FFBD3
MDLLSAEQVAKIGAQSLYSVEHSHEYADKGLLDHSERMFKIESPQKRLPEPVHVSSRAIAA